MWVVFNDSDGADGRVGVAVLSPVNLCLRALKQRRYVTPLSRSVSGSVHYDTAPAKAKSRTDNSLLFASPQPSTD